MFPLFWLLRNLGGLARWGGVLGGGQGRVGVAEPGKGGRGRGQSQAAPTAPDRTRNSSRTEAGETQKETHTHRETASYTQPERGGGAHAGGCSPAPRTGSGPESVLQARPRSLLCPRLSARAPLCAASTPQPPDLGSFSLQSSKRGFWTDARPQARILRWWKAGGTA